MINFHEFNIDYTINSGQVFLWKTYDKTWYGVNGQDVLKISEKGKLKSYRNNQIDYFRENDKLDKILVSICVDETIKFAVMKYLGLRIMRQDPFQCLISFIVSANSNIQKIQSSLTCLTKRFGKKVEFDKKEFHLFPEPKTLAESTITEIRKCGLGYRSKFVIEASRLIESEQINFEHMKNCDYKKAKEMIKCIPGIGNKVADCILLFSLDRLDAFPLDRWMVRILQKYYPDKFELKTKVITDKQYQYLHEKLIEYFGPYAGYAQQFLFKMERENYQKKWL